MHKENNHNNKYEISIHYAVSHIMLLQIGRHA